MAKKSEHKMGARTGYHLFEDGSMQIAPTHADRMDEIQREDEGLRDLVHATNGHAASGFARLAKARRAWWDSLRDDLGLDFAQNTYYYRAQDRRIVAVRNPTPPTAASTE